MYVVITVVITNVPVFASMFAHMKTWNRYPVSEHREDMQARMPWKGGVGVARSMLPETDGSRHGFPRERDDEENAATPSRKLPAIYWWHTEGIPEDSPALN